MSQVAGYYVLEVRVHKISCALPSAFVFGEDSFLAEIADQVRGYAEGYDILEKEESQKAHVSHPVNTGDGDNRARGSYDHSAGCEEHARCDEPAYDARFRAEIACDDQYGSSNLGEADYIG